MNEICAHLKAEHRHSLVMGIKAGKYGKKALKSCGCDLCKELLDKYFPTKKKSK